MKGCPLIIFEKENISTYRRTESLYFLSFLHLRRQETLSRIKKKVPNRIDGAVALIMALDRAIRNENKCSVYDEKGVRTSFWLFGRFQFDRDINDAAKHLKCNVK